MPRENEALFENLKRIAAVLVHTFGRHCEVAIHDLQKLPQSLVHIEGSVTKRKPGAPITDLVLRALRQSKNDVTDIANYRSMTKDGRTLKSSTTFIRDHQENVIGAFCVNFDITDYLNTTALVDDFVRTSDPTANAPRETFAASLNETIETFLQEAVHKAGKQPATMTREERLELVQGLEYQGAFLLRGAVEHVAKILGVSKFTVYNYLKEVRSSTESLDVNI